MNLLLESINYRVPKDVKRLLYDFYVLTYIRTLPLDPKEKGFNGAFSQPPHLKEDIEHAVNVLYPMLKDHLLRVLFLGICAELRHVDTEEAYYADPDELMHNNETFRLFMLEFRRIAGNSYENKYDPAQNPTNSRNIKKRYGHMPKYNRPKYVWAWKAAIKAIKDTGISYEKFIEMAQKIFGSREWGKIMADRRGKIYVKDI